MINPKLIYDIEHFDEADNFYSIIKTKANKNPYKIIYGHFFEYDNLFIYRSVHFIKTLTRLSSEYNKCRLKDLAHPKLEEYYKFKYIVDAYNTVSMLNKNYKKEKPEEPDDSDNSSLN